MESRASPSGWTGETPVPPPYDSSRGHGTRADFLTRSRPSYLPSIANIGLTAGTPVQASESK